MANTRSLTFQQFTQYNKTGMYSARKTIIWKLKSIFRMGGGRGEDEENRCIIFF